MTALGAGGAFLAYSAIPTSWYSQSPAAATKRSKFEEKIASFEPLEPQQVDKKLRQNQRTVKVSKAGRVVQYDLSSVNSNSPIEDAHSEHYHKGKWIFGFVLHV